MPRFYTGSGDSGHSGLIGGSRAPKSDTIFEAIGDVDELNSAIGVAITNSTDDHLADMLQNVQNKLFTVGAELASAAHGTAKPAKSVDAESVKELENGIEELSSTLPELKKFVLPGGSAGGAYLHLARSICRRAERSVIRAGDKAVNPEAVRYLNRLSSFLFVAALYINRKEGVEEQNPTY
ncbi:MAG: cob(I)yrinic acid a,c-diamide adenosyltransferase [Candidatus Micrarchaeota archaeon]|nr:cob(I)yrinic acid a,c-diamide adenosyltransferase [Candidatus Micrarchaeota archaeon]